MIKSKSGSDSRLRGNDEQSDGLFQLPATGYRLPARCYAAPHAARRDKALKRLKAQLLDAERSRQQAAQAETRRLQVGSGDRSQRIRTYNFPQGRITDHRVEGLTLYDLPNILDGDLDTLIDRLTREYQADELARLTQGA